VAPGRGKEEFVRFTPRQFSLAVAVIVLLLAAAGYMGYRAGLAGGGGAPLPAPPLGFPGAPTGAVPAVAPSTTGTSPIPGPALPGPAAKAPVLPEPAPPAAAPSPCPPGKAGEAKARVMIQVASVRSEGEARKILSSLAQEGFRGRIIPVQLSTGTWHRVQVGPFEENEAAREAIALVEKRRGLKGFIVKP